MTLVGKRQELANALSGVPDVRGFPFRPTSPDVGDAWPIMGPLDRAAGTAFLVTWLVRVLVPQDEQDASTWFDEHWPHLFEALEVHGSVSRAVPVVLSQDQLAFEIVLTAEE
jgi:hypothetical protein